MPLYMDIHTIDGVTPEALAKAHAADVAVQGNYGVEYVKYWVNQDSGKVFCLCHAPTPEAARAVHADSHGIVAEKIIEVDPEMLDGFMGGVGVNADGAALVLENKGNQRDTGIRSVMFTDIVGSTELTQTLGDDVAMDMLRVHDTIVRNALAAVGGREIKHTGDGIMACFFSAVAAIQCANRIHQEMATRREQNAPHPITVRIGAAAGEPVEQGQDLFGSTVQLAARLCARAEPGQTLVSNAIAELCIGKAIAFEDMGEAQLKGFARPVRVHSLQRVG
ncbi:MAG TPA: nickel-binding protein [Xanthomonadaceae bacterium]|jgi:class 3 adenylate cyclase|nr:nickel-binding protein [Xanthomonadaceae bacterium]